MDRAIPEVNRITHARQIKHLKEVHFRRVNSVQKGIDNGAPSSYDYPIVKLKKE